MKEIEKNIWLIAFVNAVNNEVIFAHKYGKSMDDTSSYYCAEMADFVLEKFRELKDEESREYLTPFKEGWFK